jgi:hypothetical protein
MEKQKINQTIRKMYVLNESMEEVEVSKKHQDLYFSVLETYGSWQKALKINGISKRNIRERQRFMMYSVMKGRAEKYGEEALRPKNIDEQTKEKIVEVYDSMKELTKETLKNWNKERVMYELRQYLLTGGKANGLESNNPELYHHMKMLFGSMEEASEEYQMRFGVKIQHEVEVSKQELKEAGKKNTSVKSKKTPEKLEEDPNTIRLEELLEMGYLTEDQVEEIKMSKEVTEQEMFDFLMDEIVQARIDGAQLTEERLKARNHAMYHSVIQRFGTLSNALREAVVKQVEFA